MIQVGALLTPEVISPSPLADYEVCPPHCSICVKHCPEAALEHGAVVQLRCRRSSTVVNKRGGVFKKCFECRKRCPNVRGLRNN
jgi:epoxyqueuosine reductase QueG